MLAYNSLHEKYRSLLVNGKEYLTLLEQIYSTNIADISLNPQEDRIFDPPTTSSDSMDVLQKSTFIL